MHSAPTAPRPLWAPSRAPFTHAHPLGRWCPTSLSEVGAQRRQVRRLLSGAGVSDGSVHGLSLVFEELATNGVRHGSPPVQVTVSVADPGWLVVVSDSATDCVPTPAQGRDPGRGGLGLTIVTRLSRACGWYVDDARKHVWAWLDAGEPTFAPADVRAPRPNPTAAPTPECSPG